MEKEASLSLSLLLPLEARAPLLSSPLSTDNLYLPDATTRPQWVKLRLLG